MSVIDAIIAKKLCGGGGGGGVFEMFEATTTDMETLATAPSFEDIAACYSRGKIPVIKLTTDAEGISVEYICTPGRRLYTADIPIGNLRFTCIYDEDSSASLIVMKFVSIAYAYEEEPTLLEGNIIAP